MAYSNIHPIQSFAAGAADLAYGTAVKLHTSASEPTVIQATAAADFIGVVFNPVYVKGQTVGVQREGKAEVVAASTIPYGDKVAPTTGGKFAKVSSGAYVGIAMTAASNNGEFFTMLIQSGTIAGG